MKNEQIEQYAKELFKYWNIKLARAGVSLPFMCAYCVWRDNRKPTARNCKAIAPRVLDALAEIKAGNFYCHQTGMRVFDGVIDKSDIHITHKMIDLYPWTGVSKNKGKWGGLTDEDIKHFEAASL